MRKCLLTIGLMAGMMLACNAELRKIRVEPVRFEDGKAVLEKESQHVSWAWAGGDGSLLEGADSARWSRVCRSDTTLTLDYSNRVVFGDGQIPTLVDDDNLIMERVVEHGDTLEILQHMSAFVRLELAGLPAGMTLNRIDLVPTAGVWPEKAKYAQGTWTITEGTLDKVLPGGEVPEDGSMILWLATPPTDFSGTAFAVIAQADDGRIWSARVKGQSLERGTAYRWTASCLPPEPFALDLTATPLYQTTLDIDPGEYSGITWLGGDKFAVVDDNLKGGGILHFTIPIDASGYVGTVSMRAANGTTEAEGKKRDTEGIAFVPSTNTLYVTSEKHQEIRAYDLAGHETGATLAVPEDLKAIAGNRGFESLTFNASTGLFWTTTEAPLKQDTFLPRLLRLQSFNIDGTASDRYLYQTGEPSESGENTVAYVFGVPALAALDDGRLLVLEREVYVPKGNLWEKLQRAFTDISIYVVDPVHDTAGILRKSLLCRFSTGALNLANFEGMCLGPTLPDGRRCLVLIADSQKGSGGLTNEYVKVILLR